MILNMPSNLNTTLRCDDLLQSLPSLHNGFAGYVPAIGPKQIKETIDYRSGEPLLPLFE
jgi:hypothetical protein